MVKHFCKFPILGNHHQHCFRHPLMFGFHDIPARGWTHLLICHRFRRCPTILGSQNRLRNQIQRLIIGLLIHRATSMISWHKLTSSSHFWNISPYITIYHPYDCLFFLLLSHDPFRPIELTHQESSVYNVTMDDSGDSCTVEIQRPDGRTRVSKGGVIGRSSDLVGRSSDRFSRLIYCKLGEKLYVEWVR